MRLAALTMAYNEPVWARVWARHYAGQLGAADCYVIDHGSDDGSLDGLCANVERIARDPLDEEVRAALVSDRVAALLRDYDGVFHSDVDELLIADPRRYGDLAGFAEAQRAPVVTAVGLDVQHLPAEEAPLDVSRLISGQRGWLRFSAAMCKPAFVRRAVRWAPGFHHADAEVAYSELYLFHLRYADLALGMARLSRTRSQSFVSSSTNLHQRVSDLAFETMMRNIAQLPRREVDLRFDGSPVRDWLMRVDSCRALGEDWLNVAGEELWRIPEECVGRF